MHERIRKRGYDVFLQHEFGYIGKRLKKSGRADTIRSGTILHHGRDFTLRINQNRRRNHEEVDHDEGKQCGPVPGKIHDGVWLNRIKKGLVVR